MKINIKGWLWGCLGLLIILGIWVVLIWRFGFFTPTKANQRPKEHYPKNYIASCLDAKNIAYDLKKIKWCQEKYFLDLDTNRFLKHKRRFKFWLQNYKELKNWLLLIEKKMPIEEHLKKVLYEEDFAWIESFVEKLQVAKDINRAQKNESLAFKTYIKGLTLSLQAADAQANKCFEEAWGLDEDNSLYLRQLGKRALAQEDYDKSKEYFLRIYKNIQQNKKVEANLFLASAYLAEIALIEKKYKESMAYTMLAARYKQLNSIEELEMIEQLSWLFYQLGKYEESISYLDRLLIERKGEICIDRQIDYLLLKAQVYLKQNKLVSAKEIYNEIYGYLAEIEDNWRLINILNARGLCFYHLGQFSFAKKDMQACLEIVKVLGDKNWEGSLYCNLGNIYVKQAKLAQALEYYIQALVVTEETNNRFTKVIALGNIGSIYLKTGEHAEAKIFLQEAIKQSESFEDKRGIALNSTNLGLVYFRLGENLKAIKAHQRALDIYNELQDKARQAKSLGDIAIVYADMGQNQEAVKYYQAALDILDSRPGKDKALRQFILKNYQLAKRMLK
jgi:tetratricopeptide (TPR) repeat protein